MVRSYSPLLNALMYQAIAENPISTEALVDNRLLARMKDLIASITHTLLTNTRYFRYDFKRSEFQTYYDSHKFQIDLFLRNPAFTIPPISVAVPSGMVSTYPDAAVKISTLLGSFNLEFLYTNLNKSVTILNNVKNTPYEKTQDELLDILTSLNDYEAKMVDTQTFLKSLFSKDQIALRPAPSVFVNKEGIRTAINAVLSFNSAFKGLSSLVEDIKNIDKRVDTVVTQLENTPNIDKRILLCFSHILNTIGQSVDHYGLILHEAQRVEHAFTNALNLILRHSK